MWLGLCCIYTEWIVVVGDIVGDIVGEYTGVGKDTNLHSINHSFSHSSIISIITFHSIQSGSYIPCLNDTDWI